MAFSGRVWSMIQQRKALQMVKLLLKKLKLDCFYLKRGLFCAKLPDMQDLYKWFTKLFHDKL